MGLLKKCTQFIALGICLGVGFLLIDEIYNRYGNPKSVQIFQDQMNEFSEVLDDFTYASPLAGMHAVRVEVFATHFNFEEPCTVHLSLNGGSGITCDDVPHFTSIDLRDVTDVTAQAAALKTIAREESFSEHLAGDFRIIRWISDSARMRALMNGSEPETEPEQSGESGLLSETQTFYSALVCKENECLGLSSGSNTKIEGIIAQLVQGGRDAGT